MKKTITTYILNVADFDLYHWYSSFRLGLDFETRGVLTENTVGNN